MYHTLWSRAPCCQNVRMYVIYFWTPYLYARGANESEGTRISLSAATPLRRCRVEMSVQRMYDDDIG